MKALRKEFWMEIRRSKSRFISILLIVALGVAFFSGIQASSPDMRYSGDAYYDESCLMDIKVVGTMGLTEDDVETLKNIDGIEAAEGAWSTDVMCWISVPERWGILTTYSNRRNKYTLV